MSLSPVQMVCTGSPFSPSASSCLCVRSMLVMVKPQPVTIKPLALISLTTSSVRVMRASNGTAASFGRLTPTAGSNMFQSLFRSDTCGQSVVCDIAVTVTVISSPASTCDNLSAEMLWEPFQLSSTTCVPLHRLVFTSTVAALTHMVHSSDKNVNSIFCFMIVLFVV